MRKVVSILILFIIGLVAVFGIMPKLKTDAIAGPIAPGLSITFETEAGLRGYTEGQTVSFKGSYTDTGGPFNLNTYWTVIIYFGDGSTMTLDNQTEKQYSFTGKIHQYYVTADKSFEAIASVTRYEDGVATESAKVPLNINILNSIPVVTISPSATTVVEGTNTVLTASVTGGNTPYSYYWSGNCIGTLSTATAPNTPGNYLCKVNVTDFDGDTIEASSNIIVTKKTVVVESEPDSVDVVTEEEAPITDTPLVPVVNTNDTVVEEQDEASMRSKIVLLGLMAVFIGAYAYFYLFPKSKKSKKSEEIVKKANTPDVKSSIAKRSVTNKKKEVV